MDQLADPFSDLMMFGTPIEEIFAKLSAMGIGLPTGDSADFPMPAMGPKYERRPAGLYESMLKPLVPYGIRGVIWYQGEAESATDPEGYQTLFPALIRDWRTLWNEDFPFLFVQLAPLEQWDTCNGTPFAIIRAVQQDTADTVPGTGMAVITDVGMKHDIHPKKKQPVGQRLALLAENKVYGEAVLCEAPTLSKVMVEEGRLILTFKYAGNGLSLADVSPYGQRLDGQKLGAFRFSRTGKSWKRLC